MHPTKVGQLAKLAGQRQSIFISGVDKATHPLAALLKKKRRFVL
jgi:hypothetical protein